MEEFGAATYDALPLLADTGQIAGHIDQDHERDRERVAHAHEACGLLGT